MRYATIIADRRAEVVARLLFAAHDPGGARYLSAAAVAARARGDDVAFLGRGPALMLWRNGGEAVSSSMDDIGAAFDLAVTGTGFGDFERLTWPRFRELRVPVLAVVEGWTNLALRFGAPQGDGPREKVLPDAVAVVDDATKNRLMAKPWCTIPVHVTGQPHLELISRALRVLRAERHAQRDARPAQLVFFSEPIVADYGRTARGFDQFTIASTLVDALEKWPDVELVIQPHPREDVSAWRDWRARGEVKADLSDRTTEALLAEADGVLGMTTMVLLEAYLASVPCLSLQMGRPSPVNPAVDRFVPVVLDRQRLPRAISEFMSAVTRRAASFIVPEAHALTKDAGARFLTVADRLIA